MDSERIEQKKRDVEWGEKDIQDKTLQLKNAEDLAVRLGVTPDRDQRIRQCERDLADAKAKVADAREQLALTLSDNDLKKTIAAKLRSQFAGFMKMSLEQKKSLLSKYIERIDVCRNETADLMLTFKVKIGVVAPLIEPEVAKKKLGKPALVKPVRVVEGGTFGKRVKTVDEVAGELRRRSNSERTS